MASQFSGPRNSQVSWLSLLDSIIYKSLYHSFPRKARSRDRQSRTVTSGLRSSPPAIGLFINAVKQTGDENLVFSISLSIGRTTTGPYIGTRTGPCNDPTLYKENAKTHPPSTRNILRSIPTDKWQGDEETENSSPRWGISCGTALVRRLRPGVRHAHRAGSPPVCSRRPTALWARAWCAASPS